MRVSLTSQKDLSLATFKTSPSLIESIFMTSDEHFLRRSARPSLINQGLLGALASVRHPELL